MFITFEGPEGSGKSTAVAAVSAALAAEGRRVVTTREPGGSELGRTVRQALLEGGEVVPLAELFLFLADRAQHVSALIRPVLDAGGIVLSDRYADSTLVYQGYARGLDLDVLRQLNALATGGLKPGITLLFDLPAEQGLARLTSRDRLDAEPLAFHEKVRDGFLNEASADPERWVILDASLPPDAVAGLALAAIRSRLP